jgi:hypothetical protein
MTLVCPSLPCPSLPCPSLPCPSLPCPSLPSRALTLIHDYSRPLTRPDWRNSKPIITQYKLYEHLLKHPIDNTFTKSPDRLYQTTLYHIAETDWYFVFTYIRFHGLSKYIDRVKGDYHLFQSDGIQHAIQYNNSLYNY